MSNIQRFNGTNETNDLPMPVPFASLFDEMLRPFGMSDISLARSSGYAVGPTTALDVRENADEYIVRCDVPGVDPKDIELSVEENVLSLKATRASETEQNHGALYSERRFGSWTRSIRLAKPVDHGRIEANVERGVLTVRLPKHEGAKPKMIQVRVSEG
jgi:HSP20 family protein